MKLGVSCVQGLPPTTTTDGITKALGNVTPPTCSKGKRGADYVKKIMKEITEILDCNDVKEAASKITNLMQEIGLKTKLNELGIKSQEDIEIIIKNGFDPDRVKNNPRKLTEEALREILGEIK